MRDGTGSQAMQDNPWTRLLTRPLLCQGESITNTRCSAPSMTSYNLIEEKIFKKTRGCRSGLIPPGDGRDELITHFSNSWWTPRGLRQVDTAKSVKNAMRTGESHSYTVTENSHSYVGTKDTTSSSTEKVPQGTATVFKDVSPDSRT